MHASLGWLTLPPPPNHALAENNTAFYSWTKNSGNASLITSSTLVPSRYDADLQTTNVAAAISSGTASVVQSGVNHAVSGTLIASATRSMYHVLATVACDAGASGTVSIQIQYSDPSGNSQNLQSAVATCGSSSGVAQWMPPSLREAELRSLT